MKSDKQTQIQTIKPLTSTTPFDAPGGTTKHCKLRCKTTSKCKMYRNLRYDLMLGFKLGAGGVQNIVKYDMKRHPQAKHIVKYDTKRPSKASPDKSRYEAHLEVLNMGLLGPFSRLRKLANRSRHPEKTGPRRRLVADVRHPDKRVEVDAQPSKTL